MCVHIYMFVDLISLKVCEMCFYQYVPLLPTPLALRSTAVPWAATSVKVLAAMWRLSHGVAIVSTLKPFILLLPLYNDDDGCVVLVVCQNWKKVNQNEWNLTFLCVYYFQQAKTSDSSSTVLWYSCWSIIIHYGSAMWPNQIKAKPKKEASKQGELHYSCGYGAILLL